MTFTPQKTLSKTRPVLADTDAERDALAIAMATEEGLGIFVELLKPGDFYIEQFRPIVGAIFDIKAKGQKPDFPTVRAHLKEQGVVFPDADWTDITSAGCTINKLGPIRRVREYAIRREFDALRDDIKVHIDNFALPSTGAVDLVRERISVVRCPSIDPMINIGDLVLGDWNALRAKIRHTPTGFFMFDNLLSGGFPCGGLVTIGGLTASGKSSLALACAKNMCDTDGRMVLFFGLEMSPNSNAVRVLCSEMNVEYGEFLESTTQDDSVKRRLEAGGIRRLVASPEDLRATDKVQSVIYDYHRNRRGVKVVFVDYIQLVQIVDSEQRYLQIQRVTNALKSIALEMDIPIVILSQVNRATEQQDEPMLSNLRESGSIEADSDVVLFLWRPWEKTTDTMEMKMLENDEIYLIFSKNRNGFTGKTTVRFVKKYFQFSDVEEIPDFNSITKL